MVLPINTLNLNELNSMFIFVLSDTDWCEHIFLKAQFICVAFVSAYHNNEITEK